MPFLIMYLGFIVVMFLVTISDYDCYALTPKQIYECNNLNMFACVLLSILVTIVNPLLVAVRFLYWAFHVGRKGEINGRRLMEKENVVEIPKIKNGSRIIIGKSRALTIDVDHHFNWFQKKILRFCFGLTVEDYTEE